jgi:hypothetical protein
MSDHHPVRHALSAAAGWTLTLGLGRGQIAPGSCCTETRPRSSRSCHARLQSRRRT